MEAHEPSRKTRAIVFSDIEGYSRLMGEDESAGLRLLEEHNAICVPLIKARGGVVLKFIGDAILSAFESAADAVDCGIEIQRALARRNAARPERERIVVRIGIHIGDVVLKDGDVFGDGVNIAARIEPLAKAGGIAISQTVYDMVKARPEIQTLSLGPRELKNIKDAVNIYQVLVDAAAGAGDRRPRRPALARWWPAAAAAAALAAGLLLRAGPVALWGRPRCPKVLHETLQPLADRRWSLEEPRLALPLTETRQTQREVSCSYGVPQCARVTTRDPELVRAAASGNPCPDLFNATRDDLPAGAYGGGYNGGLLYIAGIAGQKGVPSVRDGVLTCTFTRAVGQDACTGYYDHISFPVAR